MLGQALEVGEADREVRGIVLELFPLRGAVGEQAAFTEEDTVYRDLRYV